jgi:TolA-binding protein
MKRFMAVLLSIALAGSVIAAQAQQDATAPTKAKTTQRRLKGPDCFRATHRDEAAIDAQQQQIKQLSDLVQSRDQKIQQLEQRLDQSQTVAVQAQTKADTAVAQTAEQQQTVVALKSDVVDLKSNATNTAMTLQETQKNIKDAIESPMAIHYQGNHDHSWRIPGGRIGLSQSRPGCGYQYSVQQREYAGRGPERYF